MGLLFYHLAQAQLQLQIAEQMRIHTSRSINVIMMKAQKRATIRPYNSCYETHRIIDTVDE